MSKTIMWVLVIGVILAGGYFAFFSNKNKAEQASTQQQAEEQANTEGELAEQPTEGKKMAFAELVKKADGAYKCTVSQNVAGTSTTGVTYINDGMIRGEFNSAVQGMNIDSTFIVRDGFSYTWSSILPNTGFKVKVASEGAVADESTAASASYSFNAEQIGDYDCQPWTADESKFSIPTNITFKLMTS